MFKKPFSFKGRIRRLEFGLSMIISYAYLAVILIVFNIYMTLSGIESGNIIPLLMLLSIIPFYWFVFAQGAKRCHDLGNSAWYQLIPLYVFWLLFVDGEQGINVFGHTRKVAAT